MPWPSDMLQATVRCGAVRSVRYVCEDAPAQLLRLLPARRLTLRLPYFYLRTCVPNSIHTYRTYLRSERAETG